MVTQAEWRERLRGDLGGDSVDVELTISNYDTALRRAIQLWNRYRAHLKWLNLGTLSAGTSYFELTESEVGTIGVLDIRFSDSSSGPLAPMPDAYQLQVRWGRRGARIFFKRLTDMRRMERFTGSQPDWHWDSGEETLYMYNPSRPVKAMALFVIPRVPFGADIRYDEESLFEDLAVGYAKIIAADILDQAGEVPGPQGSIGSNAEQWRERGETAIAEITEKLENSLKSFPPPIWVG